MALSQREKALILIPVALGAIFGLYTFLHEPLMARRAEAETALAKVERDLKQGQRQLASEGDLQARWINVKAREEVVDASVPGKNAAALFVWYLSQAEMRSGGRVQGLKVAEKRAIDPADPTKQTEPAACGASSTASTGQASGQAAEADQVVEATAACSPASSIVVVTMDLKLAGQFGQHLHFAQMLEEMPLFLANDQIALVRTTAPEWDRATGLITEGRSSGAFNLLAASPEVEGAYSIQLYFKQAKVGPATSEMSFATTAGRRDPFVQDGVAEFTRYVENAFNGRGFAPDPENPQQWIPTPEQLG